MTFRPTMVRLSLAGAAAFLAAAPAVAAEGGGAGMPQLNPHDYSPQLFWLAVTFILLYWLMTRFALPRVGEVLSAREQRIANDLDRAAALKTEADEVLQAYEKAVAEARARASEVIRQTEAVVAQETNARQTRLAGELGERIKSAEGRIAAAKSVAMGNLTTVSSDVARAAVERLIGEAVSPAEVEQATGAAIRQRGPGAGSQG